ncbi:hypothetical protein VTK73DRAFT_37 [Phialemonium thermophilum]|uniref:Uncharacterized protein n=1 Tax=Phialemonium thermophilum TaxID=223376 RepID=A0ABR3Y8F4_9PEZI
MRYSRFRAAMLGLEPQRRNRADPNKCRVSKTKKETKTKKSERDVKLELSSLAESPEHKSEPPSPRVKQEALPMKVELRRPETPGSGLVDKKQFALPSEPSPVELVSSSVSPVGVAAVPPSVPAALESFTPVSGTHPHSYSRYLTPRSDSEVLAAATSVPPFFPVSPSDIMTREYSTFDFPGLSHYGQDHHSAWHHGLAHPDPSATYRMGSPTMTYCEHQHDLSSMVTNESTVPNLLYEGDGSSLHLKHDQWNLSLMRL